ncbi:class I lanthipeptide [Chitinophaga qingshengii]|uniref:Class I lanthipeptide n=1 Tax=Chitinophaga qingshengii TaxID=1569794 RepID=A0ABR7TUQ7_9BACT|nr:class I lanthipeptide [Chitinophaga qingshengii]MBC9934220.1 class I lanthipeptide [Chitinophaga qingshengii]
MKKKQIDLGKKLLLNKETVASLNVSQQQQLVGGIIETRNIICTEDTRAISSCRATSPGNTRPCCQIP